MPSPFPGMDPFLESQGYWPEFHSKFVNYMQEALADRVPDAYEVRIEERVSLIMVPDEGQRQSARPDLAVFRRPAPFEGRQPGGAVQTIEPVSVRLPMHRTEQVEEPRIEIRRRVDRELVTVVELLSPSNKEAPGDRLYFKKRLALLERPVHLVELDLLLGGDRLPMEDLPPGDYYAMVSRSERRPMSDVYAWSLRDPLPTIPVPLLAPDPDVALDLAAVFATVYQRGRYARSIDYAAPLGLPLAPGDAAWARQTAVAPPR